MPVLYKHRNTSRVLDGLVVRSLDFGYHLLPVFEPCVHDGRQVLAVKLFADTQHIGGALLKGIPLLLGLGRHFLFILGLLNFLVYVLANIVDALGQQRPQDLEASSQKLACLLDGGLNLVCAVDGLLLNARAVEFHFGLKFLVLNGLVEVEQNCNIPNDFLKVSDSLRVLEEGEGAEAIVEVVEQVGNSVVVGQFGKEYILVESVVEAVQVDEVDHVLVGILDFGQLACPCVNH